MAYYKWLRADRGAPIGAGKVDAEQGAVVAMTPKHRVLRERPAARLVRAAVRSKCRAFRIVDGELIISKPVHFHPADAWRWAEILIDEGRGRHG